MKELPSVIGISVIQIWLCFNFPAFIKLGGIKYYLMSLITSASAICACFYAFTFPKEYVRLVNLDMFNNFPNPDLSKTIFKVLMQGIFHTTILYLWYIDFHRAHYTWYVVWYAHSILSLVLYYNAVQRYQNAQCEESE